MAKLFDSINYGDLTVTGELSVGLKAKFSENVQIKENSWDSSNLEGNALYTDPSGANGFAFGNGTSVSTWFSYNGTLRRAIDVYNDNSKVEISTNLNVSGTVSGNGSGLTNLQSSNLSGTISYSNLPFSSTDSAQWDTAYARSLTSISGNGDSTLTLTRQDGSTYTTNLAHTHDASDITSGTLSSSRLPTITASMTNFANQSLNTSSSPEFDGISITGSIKSTETRLSFLNGSAAQPINTNELLVASSYSLSSNVPTNGMYVEGSVSIGGTYSGNGSGLTGTASLRATGTTKSDVGLGSVDNYSRAHYDSRYLAAGGKAVDSDKLDGVHASGFVKTPGSSSSFISGDSGGGIVANDTTVNGIQYTSSDIIGAPDGALYNQVYSDTWQHQIFGDYRSGQIAVRGKNNGTWQSWRKVWDSGNSDSFNASGTYSSLRARATTKSDVGLSNVPDIDFRNWGAPAVGHSKSFDTRQLSGNSEGNTTYIPDPNDIPEKASTIIFSTGYSGSSWRSGLTVKGWSTNYAAWTLSGPSGTSTDENFYLRSGVGSSWGPDRLIYHSGNSEAFNSSGTYSGLRAQATTKSDVGLGSVDNYSRAHYDARYLNESSNLADLPDKSTARSNLGLSDAATTSVSSIRSGTTKSDVGLGNVPNWSSSTFDGRYAAKSHTHDYLSFGGTSFSGRYPMTVNANGNIYSNAGIEFEGSTNNLYVSGQLRGASFRINSDQNLKDDIKPLTDNSGLQLKSWVWKDKYNVSEQQRNTFDTGVIAQEVEKEFPTCTSKGEDGIRSVDYGKLGVHHSIKLKEYVEKLEQRIDNLERRSLWSILKDKIKGWL